MSTASDIDARRIADGLLRRVVRFGRYLRAAGVHAPPGALLDLARGLDHIDLARREDFYWTAHCTLVRRRGDQPAFDAAFERFWPRMPRMATLLHEADEPPNGLDSGPPRPRRPDQRPTGSDGELRPNERRLLLVLPPPAGSTREEQPEDAAGAVEALRAYSGEEALRHRDFGGFTDAELVAARQIMASMHWRVAERASRRTVRSRHGRRLDLRRTVRGNLRYGGELVRWQYRGLKRKSRPLVLLCDVSGSMDRYTRLLLHFVHALRHGLNNVEAFVFATRLTRVTPFLKARRVDDALERVSKEVVDWSSGTRIGEALRAFNRHWARRCLSRGAVVLLISDGWDRGDVELLRSEIARLQRSAYRLIWLNPLLGSPGYQPLTRGMQAALPYVDNFLPVHNLASLEALAARLAAMDARRPARRQGPVELRGVRGPGGAMRSEEQRGEIFLGTAYLPSSPAPRNA